MSLQLRNAVTDVDTILTVSNVITDLSGGGVIQVESEQIRFESVSDIEFLGCTRGFNGTMAASHAVGTAITNLTNNSPTEVVELTGPSAPVDGVTGVSSAGTGSRYTATTTGAVYVNTGTASAPVWSMFQEGSDLGITQLTGDVAAGPGSGSQVASISDATVTGKLITGFVSGAGAVSATDTLLQAIDKLDGNDALKLPLSGGTLTGAVTYQKAEVVPVGLYTASTGSPLTPDARDIEVLNITVDADMTLNGPSNPYNGQKVLLMLANDASHSVTFATGTGNFAFGTDITSYTASASKTDLVGIIYSSAASRWYIASLIQGF